MDTLRTCILKHYITLQNLKRKTRLKFSSAVKTAQRPVIRFSESLKERQDLLQNNNVLNEMVEKMTEEKLRTVAEVTELKNKLRLSERSVGGLTERLTESEDKCDGLARCPNYFISFLTTYDLAGFDLTTRKLQSPPYRRR
jgi:predicted nuclease with TOPRIM domain